MGIPAGLMSAQILGRKYSAPDLGFTTKGAKDTKAKNGAILSCLPGCLTTLREIMATIARRFIAGKTAVVRAWIFSVSIACGTKPMRRLTSCVLWIQRANTNPWLRFMKLVTLAFLIPPLVCCYLIFEGFIPCGKRLMELRRSQLMRLQIKQGFGEFEMKFAKFDFVACLQGCLEYVRSVVWGTEEGDDGGGGHAKKTTPQKNIK